MITDLEQLKVTGDPLRLQILDVMTMDPQKGLDREGAGRGLETKQTKLYHHLALLEEHGFIRVAETRMVSGIHEKRYQVTATASASTAPCCAAGRRAGCRRGPRRDLRQGADGDPRRHPRGR